MSRKKSKFNRSLACRELVSFAGRAHFFSWQRVLTRCLLGRWPDETEADAIDKYAGMIIFDWLGPEDHCWNDRFCIAVLCDLPMEMKRLAVWCAVSNGLNGRWQIVTDNRLLTDMALEQLVLPTSPCWSYAPAPDERFCRLDAMVASELIHEFDLPAAVGEARSYLTPGQEIERARFNNAYPGPAVL